MNRADPRRSCGGVRRFVAADQFDPDSRSIASASSDIFSASRRSASAADLASGAPCDLARRMFQRRKQIERDIGRLIVAADRRGRCNGRASRWRFRAGNGWRSSPATCAAASSPPPAPWRSIPRSPPRPKSGPRRRYSGWSRSCSVSVKQRGRVDVRVAMDLAVAQKLGVFEAGNQPHDALLFAEPQMVLKADQVVTIGAKILLSELHRRPGTAAGARVGESHRLHGAEAQRIAPAPGDLFDRQAGFEVRDIVRDVRLDGLRGHAVRRQSARTACLLNGQFR